MESRTWNGSGVVNIYVRDLIYVEKLHLWFSSALSVLVDAFPGSVRIRVRDE